MRWNIETLPKAREDYARALEYLSGFYPNTPRKFIEVYRKARQSIKENPYNNSVYPDYPKYRRAFVGKYLVFYEVLEDIHIVRIHRILRGSWNITSILQTQEPPKEPHEP